VIRLAREAAGHVIIRSPSFFFEILRQRRSTPNQLKGIEKAKGRRTGLANKGLSSSDDPLPQAGDVAKKLTQEREDLLLSARMGAV
jgi:hypothetical protein